jgi:hypothetical protein
VAREKKEQSDQLRESLRRFMDFKDYSVAEWARNAKIAEGTLRNFLAGTSETLTHATLAALARAASQPIAAIIGEIPLEGYSDPIPVRYEVDATNISDSSWMPQERRFEIYLPTDLRYPNIARFGALVKDNSAHEFYRSGSIVICVDYVDIDRIPTDGDRVLLIENEHKRLSDNLTDHGIYRVTIREISINKNGEISFTFPASHRKFNPGSLPMLQTAGELTKDEGIPGYHHHDFREETTFVTSVQGLIIASYTLEEYRTGMRSAN